MLYGALAFIMLVLLAALYWGTGSSSTNAAFTLRPLCVARGLQWCDHDYPRWAGHEPSQSYDSSVLGAPASIIGSELLLGSHCGAPAFCMDHRVHG